MENGWSNQGTLEGHHTTPHLTSPPYVAYTPKQQPRTTSALRSMALPPLSADKKIPPETGARAVVPGRQALSPWYCTQGQQNPRPSHTPSTQLTPMPLTSFKSAKRPYALASDSLQTMSLPKTKDRIALRVSSDSLGRGPNTGGGAKA